MPSPRLDHSQEQRRHQFRPTRSRYQPPPRAEAPSTNNSIRETNFSWFNADSAAKSGFAFYPVDVQCDMLNLSWDGQ